MTEKRFNVFDVDGTVFLEDHKKGSYHIGEKENVDIPCLNDIADRLNTYADENEQLKQFKNTVFDLIDKEIKETKEIFEEGKIDLMTYNASMITLIGLKEQLKGDVE